MKTPDMKPCPFCGGTKLKIDSKRHSNIRYNGGKREEYHVVTVRCNKCHARGSSVGIWLGTMEYNAAKRMEMEAIEAWNRRVTDENT